MASQSGCTDRDHVWGVSARQSEHGSTNPDKPATAAIIASTIITKLRCCNAIRSENYNDTLNQKASERDGERIDRWGLPTTGQAKAEYQVVG